MKTSMKLGSLAMSCILVATLAGCMPHKTVDDEDCGISGKSFEMSTQPLPAQDKAKAEAALGMALAELGFIQSEDVPRRFEVISPTPAVKYLVMYDWDATTYENEKQVRTGHWGLHIQVYGKCGGEYETDRDKFLKTIAPPIESSLQPYATKPIIVSDTIEVSFD